MEKLDLISSCSLSKGKAYSKITFLQKVIFFFTGPRERKSLFVSTSEETDTLKKKPTNLQQQQKKNHNPSQPHGHEGNI